MENKFRSNAHVNRLTTAPALPEGWHKVGPGLWRHENGEESRINPSSLITNTNFGVLRSAEGGGTGQANVAAGAGAVASGMGESAVNSSFAHLPVEQPPAPPPSTGYAPAPQAPAMWTAPQSVGSGQGTVFTGLSAPPPPPPAAAPEPKPGPGNSLDGIEWYFMDMDNKEQGPITSEEISRLYDRGEVHNNTYVWCGAMASWDMLSNAPLVYVPAPHHAAPPPPTSQLVDSLVGQRVVIDGLSSKPELNGATAIAVSFDDAKGRYNVQIESTSAVMALKPGNLTPVSAESPHSQQPSPRASAAPPAAVVRVGSARHLAPTPPSGPAAAPAAAQMPPGPPAGPPPPQTQASANGKEFMEISIYKPVQTAIIGLQCDPLEAGAGISGVKVTAMKPDGLGYQAGVRVGDTLLRVNGQPCIDPTQTASMLRAAEGQLALDLLRSPPPPPPPMAGERRLSAARRLSASGMGRRNSGALGSGRMQTPPGPPPGPMPTRSGSGGGGAAGGGGGGNGALIGQAATQLMLRLQAQLQEIADEAAGEELRDNGGGEHGSAQALQALESCGVMISDFQQQLQTLLAANSVQSGSI